MLADLLVEIGRSVGANLEAFGTSERWPCFEGIVEIRSVEDLTADDHLVAGHHEPVLGHDSCAQKLPVVSWR